MLNRRRLWARLLALPALWSAVVAASPAPIHACGGTEHAPAAAAETAAGPHAAHADHGVSEDRDAGDTAREGHRDCECVGCGAPAVATAVPATELPTASPVAGPARTAWPAAARSTVARSAHALPFANGPPRR